jgi:GMP synthase-like glutamine amidotransferase
MLGILICDHVDEELRPIAGGDLDEMFKALLLRVDPSVELRFYDAIGRELPQSAAECDGYILTGSHHSAYEDLPWIEELSGFIRSAHAEGVRMVGLCFGHQLIAQALGGRVEKAAQWTAGVQTLELEAQPWFEGGTTALLAMHEDVVTALPAGARIIGSGTTADIPAYLIGETVLGIQYHPEFTRNFVEALILRRVDRIGREASEAALVSLQTQTAWESTMISILRFLRDEKRPGHEVTAQTADLPRIA